MEGFKLLKRLSLITLILCFSTSAFAKRWGLAKKYEILPMDQSHEVIGQADEGELNANSIKVLVWNLYKGDKKTWARDFKKLSEGQDILLLQEGYLNNRMVSVFEQMPKFQFDMGVSFIYKKDHNTRTGSLIGSSVKPSEVYFTRTKDYEPFIKTPKTTTYAYYPVEGSNKELLVINIHGINLANHKSFVNHVDQAVELIEKHDGPIVFGGDFNTRTKKRTRHLKRTMKALGMNEVGFRNDKRMRALKVGQVLDHVFIKGLLVRDADVKKDIKGSDHKAMVLDLVVDNK